MAAEQGLVLTRLCYSRALVLRAVPVTAHDLRQSVCAACSSREGAVKGSSDKDVSQGNSQDPVVLHRKGLLVMKVFSCPVLQALLPEAPQPRTYCFPCLHTVQINNL